MRIVISYNKGMYICICNALKDKQLKSVIEQGACCADDAFAALGCQRMCGQCVEVIEDSIPSVTDPAAQLVEQQ